MFLPAQFHHLIDAGSFLGAECFDDLCLFGGLTHYYLFGGRLLARFISCF